MEATKDFGWQGLRLRIPESWNLGKVDGDAKSGYARLDDPEIVRAEIEWRSMSSVGSRVAVEDLVDRYLAQLEKKAKKAGLEFRSRRRARFLTDKRWLEGCTYEAFIWEADYRAFNLARLNPASGRIVLIRLLARHDEPQGEMQALADEVFRSLEDQPREADRVFWGLYGLEFEIPAAFQLQEHQLRSGHIKLNFERGRSRQQQLVHIHRVSMAQMLLQDTDLDVWYRAFFRKELRELKVATEAATVLSAGGAAHQGIVARGVPRSRLRMLLRPLPLVNPRPRYHLTAAVWHCRETNRICIVEHLYRKRDVEEGLLDTLTHGYVCHTEKTPSDARSNAELASGAQRTAQLEDERGG